MAVRKLTPEEMLALNQAAMNKQGGGTNVVDTTAGGTQYSPVGYKPPVQYKPTPFSYKMPAVISFDKALGQAQAQLSPEWEASRTSAGTINQQQMAQLRQALNARGMLDAGALSEGMKGLSANLSQTLAGLDTGYRTNTANMAQNIVAQDEARKQWMAQQAFQAWQAQEALKAQQAQMASQDYWNQVAQQVVDRNFQYGASQDALNREFQAQQAEISRAIQEAGLTGQYQGQQTLAAQQQAFNEWLGRQNLALDRQREGRLAASGGGSAIAPGGVDLSDRKFTPYLNEIKRMREATISDGFDTIPMYTQGQIIRYILNLGLSDEETAALLNYIGASSMQTINTGGKSYVNVKPR